MDQAERIANLTARLEDLIQLDNFRQAQALRFNIEAEINRLAA